jgi:electron transfer flavoprotein alpha subunit
MGSHILVLAEHWEGQLTDATFELLALGRELADATQRPLETLLFGHGVKALVASLGLADKILCADHDSLAGPAGPAQAEFMAKAIRETAPGCVLAPLSNPSWDLVGHLVPRLDFPFLNFCRDLSWQDGKLEARCLLYGGKMEVVVQPPLPVLCGMLPGVRPAAKGRAEKQATVEDVPVTPRETAGVKFLRLIPPQKGDVDITQQTVLVSVGRGIQSQDNIGLAEELAKALGGAVSGSRPVIDQGWLPLSRQVGKSGATVKPKLYLALGISGAPEHLEGMKGAELTIAINTDRQAPIFAVAQYGAVIDLFDIVPPLTEEIKKRQASRAA